MVIVESSNLPDGGWWQQYGPIGVVAGLALGALYLAVRHYLAERREEKARNDQERKALEEQLEEQRRSLADLNKRLVDMVQQNHKDTLELIDAQRADHEERFSALLERHIASSEMSREKTLDIATAVTKAIQSLSRKLSPEGRDRDG